MNSFLNPNRNQTTRVKYSSKKVSTITEVFQKEICSPTDNFYAFFPAKKNSNLPQYHTS